MHPTVVIRSALSKWGTVAIAVIAAATIIQTLVTAGWNVAAPLAIYPLLVVVIAWAIWGKPAVVLGPKAVRLINPLRTYQIPYSAITEVSARGALRVHVGERHYTAWAAAARGGYRATVGHDVPAPAIGEGEKTIEVNLDAAAAAQLLGIERTKRAGNDTQAAPISTLNLDVVVPLPLLIAALIAPLI